MRVLGFVLCFACAPAKAPVEVMPNHALKFEGTITDLDFGCSADRDCGVKVDDIWIWIPGGMLSQPRPPRGQVIGIQLSGGADALKKQKGMRVEVFAVQMPIYDASMNIAGYDPKKLTLDGDDAYYVRAK